MSIARPHESNPTLRHWSRSLNVFTYLESTIIAHECLRKLTLYTSGPSPPGSPSAKLLSVQPTQYLRKRISVLILRFAYPAWLDDAHLDRQPGPVRASLRDYQGRDRRPPAWSQDVLEQRYVEFDLGYVLATDRAGGRRLTANVSFPRRILCERLRSGESRPPRCLLREVP